MHARWLHGGKVDVPDMGDDPLGKLPHDFRPEVIFEVLNRYDVRYVIVGGMAAVLHGAEVSTVDLDLVIDQSRANRDRAVDALAAMNAERVTYTRDAVGPGEVLPENGDGLVEPVESFRTRDGRIDLLREALVIGGYNDLSANALVFFVEDQEVYVADLDSVIAAKEASTERKDQLHLRALYDLRNALDHEEAQELRTETYSRSPTNRLAEIDARVERTRQLLARLEVERDRAESDAEQHPPLGHVPEHGHEHER